MNRFRQILQRLTQPLILFCALAGLPMVCVAAGADQGESVHEVAQQAAEQAVKKTVSEAAQQAAEQVIEKTVDKAAEKAAQKTVEKVAEKAVEKVAGEAVKKAVDDVWLSPQVSVYTFIPAGYTEGQAAKHRAAFARIDQMFTIAKEIGFENIVFGSDIISSPKDIENLLGEFTQRAKWFSNIEILRQATSKGGELLALSGAMNRYPGKLGVIEKGAHADLLLLDGNPLEDLNAIVDFEQNMDLIMKAGVVYKNTLKQ